MFINHEYIENLLENAKKATEEEQEMAIFKAENGEKLDYKDIAILLQVVDEKRMERIFKIAGEIKKKIYGNRIVLFAPLYVSNYCVNNCVYCGFQHCNKMPRRKLNREEIQEEVRILEKMGHKRLALEAGEDPVNCSLDYILEALDAIYETKLDNGSIRRVNVNIAATTVEDYKKLHGKGIGTYILFQETYHKPTYEAMHPKCIKGDYEYHLTAFDRAMQAGIEDVGAGALFGLYDPKFEVLALMMHNEHLENEYGVGFHTISMPRLRPAEGMNIHNFPYLVDDETFKRLVAVIRIAVPFTGIIMSTRETAKMRKEVLRYGVSQVSAGSCTGIGGYKESEQGIKTEQFEVSDERRPLQVIHDLIDDGYIPSYCTACYRQGRTGDRFMQLAKTGNIQNVCTPNALMTLMEYMLDYGDKELIEKGQKLIDSEIQKIEREDIKKLLIKNMELLKNGQRDLFL
jgi:2-iminoacetate synthase